jgi:hypothetical protein
MRVTRESGFSIVELIVALGLALAVMATIFDLLGRARRRFDAEPEIADRQQRVRVAVDTLTRDLAMARAVLPYRLVGASADPAGTFTNRVVTAVVERPDPEEEKIRTYYLRAGETPGGFQLMRAEGAGPDAPVVDYVTDLSFTYFGEQRVDPDSSPPACTATSSGLPLVPLSGPELSDGPWCALDEGGVLLDADLLRIRHVVVGLAASGVSGDLEFTVAPRNLNQLR